jgi:hypothetical protein
MGRGSCRLALANSWAFREPRPTNHQSLLPPHLRLGIGRKPSTQCVFCHDPWESEVQQVITAAGLGASAGHMKTAEWMAANDGAGDGSIDVEVTYLEIAPDSGDVVRATGIKAAGQSKGGRVRQLDRFVQVVCLMNR